MSDRPPSKPGRNTYDFVNVDIVFHRLALRTGMNVLDVGCGLGGYALDAAQRVAPTGQVHAVDKWPTGIDHLRKQAKSVGISNISATCIDAINVLPVPEQSIDICLMSMVLHHLAAAGTALNVIGNLYPILKPDARLFIIEFEKIDGPPGPPKRIRLSRQQVRELLPPSQFELEDVTQVETHIFMQCYRFNPA